MYRPARLIPAIKIVFIILGVVHVYEKFSDTVWQNKSDCPRAGGRYGAYDYGDISDVIPQGLSLSNYSVLVPFEEPYSKERLSSIKPLPQHLINRNAPKVIVDAYYRSGSSILGRILKYHPNSFYNFEPFMQAFLTYKKNGGLSKTDNVFVANGRFVQLAVEFRQEIGMTAISLLNCTFGRVDLTAFRDEHPWLRRCVSAEKKLRGKLYNQRRSSCVQYIKNQCHTSDVRAFKSIRLPMDLLLQIIKIDPSIKVIYNSRDPRAMFSSRVFHERYSYDVMRQKIQEMCIPYERDLKVLKEEGAKFKDNIFMTSYDDVAGNMLETAENIYKWLKLPIEKQTLSDIIGRSKNYRYNINTVPGWLSRLNDEEIAMVNKSCEFAITYLGYHNKNGL